MLKQSQLVKRVPYDENREILLSNLTGDIMLVSKEVSNLFDRFKTQQDITNFSVKEKEVVEKLKKLGYLVDDNISKNDEIDLLRSRIEFYRENSKPGYSFFVTIDCNFGCKYCYQKKNVLTMSEDTASKIVKFIASSLASSRNDEVMIEFTGGEPLLQFPLIKKIIENLEASLKGKTSINIGLVTNGSLISKEISNYLNLHNWTWVQVTLDGLRDIHNALRPYANGRGTFDDVKNGIYNALNACKKVIIRTNIDRTNEDYVGVLWQSLKDEGFCRENVYLSPMLTGAPLQASRHRANLCYTEYIGSEKLKKYIDLAHDLGFKTTYYLPRFMYCGILSTKNNLMFYPDGSIFTCWYATGGLENTLMIGNVNNNPVFNENKRKLDSWNILDFEKCRNCDIVTFCGGGCVADALTEGGKNLEPKCPPYAYNFEEYIKGYVKYKMLAENENE